MFDTVLKLLKSDTDDPNVNSYNIKSDIYNCWKNETSQSLYIISFKQVSVVHAFIYIFDNIIINVIEKHVCQ